MAAFVHQKSVRVVSLVEPAGRAAQVSLRVVNLPAPPSALAHQLSARVVSSVAENEFIPTTLETSGFLAGGSSLEGAPSSRLPVEAELGGGAAELAGTPTVSTRIFTSAAITAAGGSTAAITDSALSYAADAAAASKALLAPLSRRSEG